MDKKISAEKHVSIIGSGIIDVLVGAVDESIFKQGSQSMNYIKLSFGGDALNESVALSRLGKNVELISKVGDDETGQRILDYMKDNNLSADCIKIQPGLETSVNIVMVDDRGERHFLTNPNSSLRKLEESDIIPHIDKMADIVSFASMFVSPCLDIPAMERIFKQIKSKSGRTLLVDVTRAKNGESLEDLKCLFPYIDYFLPNDTEISMLTGESDPYKNIELLMSYGINCAVLKCGSKGCLIAREGELYEIPSYPVSNAVDTTGAGDCFAAGFLYGLLQKWSLKECGKFACAVASCSVEQVGAVTGLISLEEPMRRYQQLSNKH